MHPIQDVELNREIWKKFRSTKTKQTQTQESFRSFPAGSCIADIRSWITQKFGPEPVIGTIPLKKDLIKKYNQELSAQELDYASLGYMPMTTVYTDTKPLVDNFELTFDLRTQNEGEPLTGSLYLHKDRLVYESIDIDILPDGIRFQENTYDFQLDITEEPAS